LNLKKGAFMVSNTDENHEFIVLQDNTAGYLVCSFCRGYYELQEGENPDDFDRCECGNPLEFYRSRSQFHSRITSDSAVSDPAMEYNDKSEVEDQKLDEMKIENGQMSENRQIMDRFIPQEPVSDEVLANLKEDIGRDLWEVLDQYKTIESENETLTNHDVIEMDRLMMMVDQKRAIKENGSDFQKQSLYQKIGPVGFLGVAIVLVLAVLVLILTLEII
jgi:hypothetical protein